jgi:hypothetical protein
MPHRGVSCHLCDEVEPSFFKNLPQKAPPPSLRDALAELETLFREEQSLRPENRRLLILLKELAAKPDELGAGWWDEFEKTLRETRMRVRTSHHV